MLGFKEFMNEGKVEYTLYFDGKNDAEDVAMELNTLGIEWSEDDWNISSGSKSKFDSIDVYSAEVDKELKDILKSLKLKPEMEQHKGKSTLKVSFYKGA